MRLHDRKSPALLVTLATIGIGVSETQAAGPRDYEGPQGWSQDGAETITVPPPAPPASPPSEAPSAPPAEGDFPVEDETPTAPVAPAAPPPEEDGGCADGDFCVEDLTTDEEALKKEMAPKATPKLAGPSGTIDGRILDATSGSPLIGVNVTVVGTDYKTKTDIDGRYSLPVPPGTYQVRIWYDAYEGMTISGVTVAKDEAATVNREIKPIAGMTQTVAVTAEINKESAAGKLVERKKSVAARDMMSREDIRRSGGGATSAVARRIVGSTIVGGRFLFVRGLGHRYGNTLLDGARLPSPDPNLRTVPLDIFPSGVLSAINVQKTATPDVPADFAGASVQLESREIPDKFTWSLQGMFGMNTATSFRERAEGERFFGDGVAFGNLGRGIPSAFDTKNPIDLTYAPPGSTDRVWTNDQIERFGESMPSTRTRITDTTHALPNASFQGTIGNTFKPWGTELGVFVGAAYTNQRQTLREDIRVFNGDCKVALVGNECPDGQTTVNTDTPRVDYDSLRTTDNVQLSGLGALKWRLNKHNRVAFTALYTRDADREARILDGKSRPTAAEQTVRNVRQRYIMRSILFTRLGGKHEIPAAKGFTIDWFGSYAQARLDDPLLREMLFRQTPDGYIVDQAESGKFQFFKLIDHSGSGGLDFTAPFKQWRGLDARFKFGGWAEGKRRTFTTRAFDYEVAGGLEDSIPRGDGNILTPDTIGGGTAATSGGSEPFFIREFTRAKDSYNGNQRVFAGYAMLDLPLVRWFKLVGGARFEANDIKVLPFDRFGRTIADEDKANIKDRVVLPSASLIFSPTGNMNIRLVGAETVARPEFRELAPFLFTDFVGGFDVQGNPRLQSTRIWNADLRWEWFPSANEVVAVSAFFKHFDDPIERIVASRGNMLQTYINADYANNVGAEAELRKNLEFIAKPLRNLSVGANFAYIYSRAHLPTLDPENPNPLDAATSRVRPMEGQSPWVINAYLGYDNDRSGTNVRLLYNAFGKRIAFVGIRPLPDIYELPVHTLDLTLLQRVYKGLSLNFAVFNMMNWKQRLSQGGVDNLTYLTRRGTAFVIGLSYTF